MQKDFTRTRGGRGPLLSGLGAVDDLPKVTQLRGGARSVGSPSLARPLQTRLDTTVLGFLLLRSIWPEDLLSLEGLDDRYVLSEPELFRREAWQCQSGL